MVKVISYIWKKMLRGEPIHEQLGDKCFRKDQGINEFVRKDKYVFSSVFPNEEIMRKVDAIMTEGEHYSNSIN